MICHKLWSGGVEGAFFLVSYLTSRESCPNFKTLIIPFAAKGPAHSHTGGFGVVLELGLISTLPDPFLGPIVEFFDDSRSHKFLGKRFASVLIIVRLLEIQLVVHDLHSATASVLHRTCAEYFALGATAIDSFS